jgi:hypothetical protein
MDDGEYLVFVELERSPAACENALTLIEDTLNLTKQSMGEWRFLYRKDKKEYDITLDNLLRIVPTSPTDYEMRFGTGDDSEDDLEAMLEAARVPVRRAAPKNDWTEQLRIAAGLK